MPDQVLAPVDPVSESFMAIETDDYPKTDFTQFQLRGKIDAAALALSWEEALADVPVFQCHLRVCRVGLRRLLVWVKPEGLVNRLTIEDCRHLAPDPFEPMEFSFRYHALRIHRRLDLFHEYPVQGFLARVADDRHILAIVYHHSALDATRLFTLMNGILTRYHRRVAGGELAWAKAPTMTSQARAGHVVAFPSRALWTWTQLRDSLAARRVDHIATREQRDVRGRHGVRAVIEDRRLVDALVARAKRNEATLGDLLLVVAWRSVLSWNRERDAPAERARLALVVNLRARIPFPEHGGAGLSAFDFPMRRYVGLDLDGACRAVRDRRLWHLKHGTDLGLHRFVIESVEAIRVLPPGPRHALIRLCADRLPCTITLSNVGVVWPRIVDGRQTGDSEDVGAGDFVIDDLHSCPSIARNIGLGLIARTFQRRLFLNFTVDRFRFHKDEVLAFRDHVVRGLENAA